MSIPGSVLYPYKVILVARKDMFSKGLSAKARQALAHDVYHRLGGPAIPAIVEKREGQNLTIYRRYVPRQRNNIVRGARFCVQIPLGGGVPHTTLEELGVTGNRQ